MRRQIHGCAYLCTEVDTAAFEVATLSRAFGAALPVVLGLCVVRQLKTRADLDALVAVLTTLGL